MLSIREQREYLNRDGNLRVPCSRYGRDTFECTEVAIVVERILSGETGEPTTEYSLDGVMSMVVNDSDEIETTLRDYGPEWDIDVEDYL